MYNRILMPVNNLETGRKIIREAMAVSSPNCTFTVLHVQTPVYHLAAGTDSTVSVCWVDDYLTEECEEILDKASYLLRFNGIEPKTVLKWGNPAIEICRYAEEANVNLIVMGKHDKGPLKKLLLGSVSQTVMERAPCPVLVVK